MSRNARELLGELSLEEKAGLVSGADFWHLKAVPRLEIPSVMVTDGPHGLRKQRGSADQIGIADSVPATCFPTASATASSWDRGLMREIGVALAEECLAQDVAVILGPGVNMKRSPLCGRNFEYISEDPFLAGEMAAAIIDGVQSLGVGTSLKHFAVNNQEHRRMTIDAVVDERTLRELYLPAFERAVRQARPWTVMCAYNRLNGTYCSENRRLLQEMLREEWGFDGVLVTDWGACNDRVAGLAAGQDLEMPYSGEANAASIVAAVKGGSLDEAVLDRSVLRVLELILRAEASRRPGFSCNMGAHHALARKAARESMVLLKNEGDLLPLAKEARVALIGAFAERARFQGAGSSLINPARLDSAVEEIKFFNSSVPFVRGYDPASDRPDPALIEEAARVAAAVDVPIVFVGLTESYEMEGADRVHLRLPASHDALVEAVAAANPDTVVVLSNGAAVELPWLDRVGAVLEGFLAGEAGAGAALDLVYGHISPCGKLAESWPVALGDLPSSRHFPDGPATVEYREGLYVGYRWFDASGAKPRFPFGFGLSYTKFDYSDLVLSRSAMSDTDTLKVSLDVTNVGKRPGSEIVQIYVRDLESTVWRPDKELKDFAKVTLGPGEKKRVEFELDGRAFAYWDCDLGAWNVESGDFEIVAAASSADPRLAARVRVESSRTGHRPRDLRAVLPSYYAPRAGAFDPSDKEFAALLGREPPPRTLPPRAAFDMTSTLGDIKGSILGRLLYRVVLNAAWKTMAGDEASRAMLADMVDDMPLRNITALSGGSPSFRSVRFMLALLNIGRKKH